MARWVEYKYPKLERSVKNLVDSEGDATFTVGGFLRALESAGIRDVFDMDSVSFSVPMGRMVEIFGVPEIRVGEYEEIWGPK